MSAEETLDSFSLVELTADITSAYVSNNSVRSGDLSQIICEVHAALLALQSGPTVEPVEPQRPAVSIKKSVAPDYIISLEDGKKFKSLRRHLMISYGMTPDDYRRKWGLPADYPMVAANYAAQRSELAKSTGLGRKAAMKVPVPEPEPAPAPELKRRGRKPKAVASEE